VAGFRGEGGLSGSEDAVEPGLASGGDRAEGGKKGRGGGGEAEGTRGVAVGDGEGGATVEQARNPAANTERLQAGEALAEEGVRAVEVAAFERDMAEFAEDAGGFEFVADAAPARQTLIKEGRSTREIVLGIGNLAEREAGARGAGWVRELLKNAQGFGEVAARTGEIAAHMHRTPEAEE